MTSVGLRDSERRCARVIEPHHLAGVAVEQERGWMAGARVHEHALERIDADARDRGHLVVVHVADHPPEDLRRRRVVERIGAEGAPLPAHHGGGLRTPAAHIADAEHDRAVGAEDGVVPVAADVDSGATGGVFACEAQPRRGRKLRRKQALLEAEGDLVLVLEGERSLERLRRLGGERSEELPFARRETAALGQQRRSRRRACRSGRESARRGVPSARGRRRDRGRAATAGARATSFAAPR